MMTTNDMRGHIIAAYGGGEEWRKKVQKMPDNKVLAFYKSLQKRKKVK